MGVHGKKGSWQVIKRMLDGKPVIIHGDGTSLWTMTDSRDFAEGFIGLFRNPHAIGDKANSVVFDNWCDKVIAALEKAKTEIIQRYK